MPPATTRLLLISHSATASLRVGRFPLDEGLDHSGQEAAKAMAPVVAAALGSGATVAVCGPDRRTQETAAALGLIASVDPELRDLDAGRWAGQSVEDVLGTDPEGFGVWMRDPDTAPHGGESVVELLGRVSAWLDGISASGMNRTVAVSHPSVVRAAVLAALGAPSSAFWSVDVEPLAMVRLQCTVGRWRLRFGVRGEG